jgi:hypothetical protein
MADLSLILSEVAVASVIMVYETHRDDRLLTLCVDCLDGIHLPGCVSRCCTTDFARTSRSWEE